MKRRETTLRIAIIGAGVTGLSTAYDLTKAGHNVVVFEAGDKIGGLASGFKVSQWDWTLEKFYHHWFASDKHLLRLTEELGVRRKVLFLQPRTVIYHKNRFYPLDSALAVLNFPGLQPLARIRFAAVLAFIKSWPDGVALEKYTAEDWLKKWMGGTAYRTMMQPLLVSKFGKRYSRKVTMAWMWARLHARTTRLGTFEGGFQGFMDVLAERVRQQDGDIHLSTPVYRIGKDPLGGLTLQTPTGPQTFDQCVATISPRQMSGLVPDLPESYRQQLINLRSMGAVVMVMALDRQLTEYYWHSLPKEEGFPFLALVEHTNFVSPEHFGGDHIVYCGDYLQPDHEYFELTKEELFHRFLPAIPRFNPDFELGWVKQTWLFRSRYAQPVPFVNHSQVIPNVKTPVPGLWLASMSQVYPWDRGTNYAIEMGRRVARELATTDACS